MEVILDCRKLTQRESAHLYLQEQFGFPSWYGKNLDALYDCLTELSDCRVVLQDAAALFGCGNWGETLLDTLRDAARDNPGLELAAQN